MKLIFLGPPGSGKGTQAKTVAAAKSIAHISMGDILRAEIKGGTELGKKVSDHLKNGSLVPDELVNEIAKNAIIRNKEKGFLLDGYPRTLAQAEFVATFADIDKVVYIDVPKEAIVKRLTGRLSCKACGAVYHVTNKPPKKDGICDGCGGALYIREDDKEETIAKRFEVYEKETRPLVGFYGSKIVKIDGSGDVETVLGRIKAAV